MAKAVSSSMGITAVVLAAVASALAIDSLGPLGLPLSGLFLTLGILLSAISILSTL